MEEEMTTFYCQTAQIELLTCRINYKILQLRTQVLEKTEAIKSKQLVRLHALNYSYKIREF